jgi:plasmid maintenance system antidote protein VapI
VDPASLSQIINGKRSLTARMKMKLGISLGLSPTEIEALPATAEEALKRSAAQTKTFSNCHWMNLR